MTISKHLFSSILILIFFGNKVYSQSNYIEKIDSLMNWTYNNGMFNGNVLVSKNNKIIYNSSFGFADANKTIKLTGDYKFSIGSITKEFSAVAIQQLKEKGKLDLNDKISKFFPELPKWSNEVTVKDLLLYTSGIPDINWKKIKSNKDIFEDLKTVDTLNFTPGTRYEYNNNNFFLRLSIVEKITGMSYKEYIDKNIFIPLKMKSSEITPILNNKNLAKGFNDKFVEDKPDFLVGGAFITTTDLLLFINKLHSNKIISKNSLFELGQHFDQEDTQSALGEAKFVNQKLIEHSHDGRGGNYDAIMFSDIENDFSIILLSNNFKGKIFEISDALKSIMKNRKYSLPKIQENMNTKNMTSQENPVTLLTKSMTEYMETAQPSYSKKDIAECENILNQYLSEILQSKSKDEGMKIVQNTVEKLNVLNEKCNFELIETSEREQIAEIIILAGSKKGYNTPEEDITEDWREW